MAPTSIGRDNNANTDGTCPWALSSTGRTGVVVPSKAAGVLDVQLYATAGMVTCSDAACPWRVRCSSSATGCATWRQLCATPLVEEQGVVGDKARGYVQE